MKKLLLIVSAAMLGACAKKEPETQPSPVQQVGSMTIRFVEPSEIAGLVAWLCSAECSFSTGAVFDISGGRATY